MAGAKAAGRRGHGEDGIYFDASKSRYVGAVSVGYGADGRRIRRKVVGRSKAEVRDKLKAPHREMDSHIRPGPRYTVGDALDDWLADGLLRLSSSRAAGRDTTSGPIRRAGSP